MDALSARLRVSAVCAPRSARCRERRERRLARECGPSRVSASGYHMSGSVPLGCGERTWPFTRDLSCQILVVAYLEKGENTKELQWPL
jgi:hypothetical protein